MLLRIGLSAVLFSIKVPIYTERGGKEINTVFNVYLCIM